MNIFSKLLPKTSSGIDHISLKIEMSAGLDVLNLLTCDDGESEDSETLQRQALFVPEIKGNEDLSAPPMDGFEYIKRVVAEAKKCDAVVVKKVETKPQKNLNKQVLHFPEEKSCPQFCMDKNTQLHTVAEFSNLRLKYEARRSKISQAELQKLRRSVPKERNQDGWLKLLSNTPPNIADAMGLKNSSIELCLAITQPKIVAVIEYMEDWIAEGELSVPVACQWIYTLLTCIELPLDPDVCATLRGIVRTLISRRSKLESLESEELPHINIIICIIGRYFNQYDLADPMD